MKNTFFRKQPKHNKLLCRILLTAVLLLFSCLLVSAICWLLVRRGTKSTHLYIDRIETFSNRDIAIVPGAGTSDGTISKKGRDRLLAATALYKNNFVSQIVVSGGASETEPMAHFLQSRGIPIDAILCDARGVDTYETLARTREYYGAKAFYFCTQELYADRAAYLMEKLDIDGIVVCADSLYYKGFYQHALREYFASTKAVLDSLLYHKQPKTTVQKEDFVPASPIQKDSHTVQSSELESPADCIVTDTNPGDAYDVLRAVEYARSYALSPNPAYPVFEYNCTNFVSQCLVAGGIAMQGEGEVEKSRRYTVSDGKTDWFSLAETASDWDLHYSTTKNFVNTDAFIRYFTKQLHYPMSIYDNDYEGKRACLNEIASGDVIIFFYAGQRVAHLALVSGVGEWNAYYCSNTIDRKDAGAFRTTQEDYAQFGILHMSQK